MAPTTNNKPSAQHTETSGGRSGQTSWIVTQVVYICLLKALTETPRYATDFNNYLNVFIVSILSSTS